MQGLTGDPNSFLEKSDNSAYNLCPRPIDKTDFADYSGTTIHKIVLFNYEMDYFKLIADQWNNNPENLSSFISYLKEFYKNRVIFCRPK